MTGQEFTEREKIITAVKDFADKMETRMLAKYDEGLRGWDNPKNEVKIYDDLQNDVVVAGLGYDSETVMLDIANRAMMLDRFDTEK